VIESKTVRKLIRYATVLVPPLVIWVFLLPLIVPDLPYRLILQIVNVVVFLPLILVGVLLAADTIAAFLRELRQNQEGEEREEP